MRRLTQEEFIARSVAKHGGRYGYDKIDYKGYDVPVVIHCDRHGDFLQTPNNHLRGKGCPMCKNSIGEEKIFVFLKKHNVEFVPQYRVPNEDLFCRNKTLHLDFYLPNSNTVIEFNGKQHYKEDPFFHKHKIGRNFECQQRRDDAVRVYCQEHKMKLIEIPYTELNNIENILKKRIKNKIDMIGYLEAVSTMHTRGVVIDEKDYIFTLCVVLGEEPQNAFALSYDMTEFKKVIGTEDEDSYLSTKRKDAETMLSQQSIIQLKELLDESYRTQVQSTALDLKDFKFTGHEAIQILNNLLKTRIDDLESSSVKDVVGIIKTLSDAGALDTGDSGFSRHFIQISPKFLALCVACGREFDCHSGLGAKCPHCGQEYRWSENRFYPQPSKL